MKEIQNQNKSKEKFIIELTNMYKDNRNAINDTIKLLNIIDEKEYAGRLEKEGGNELIYQMRALRLIKN